MDYLLLWSDNVTDFTANANHQQTSPFFLHLIHQVLYNTKSLAAL